MSGPKGKSGHDSVYSSKINTTFGLYFKITLFNEWNFQKITLTGLELKKHLRQNDILKRHGLFLFIWLSPIPRTLLAYLSSSASTNQKCWEDVVFFFLVGMKASLTLLIPLITLRQASYCVSASAFKSPQPLHLYCSGGEIWTLIWIILSCLIPFFHSLTFLPDCKFLRTKTQTEFCVLIPSWNYVLYIGGFQ